MLSGLKYPFYNEEFSLALNEEVINSSLYQILMTEKGERVMEIYFGVKLRDLFFESVRVGDSFILREIETRVSEAIEKFEKRIVVKPPGVKVELIQGEEDQNAVSISFDWAFKEDLGSNHSFSQKVVRHG